MSRSLMSPNSRVRAPLHLLMTSMLIEAVGIGHHQTQCRKSAGNAAQTNLQHNLLPLSNQRSGKPSYLPTIESKKIFGAVEQVRMN